MVLNIGAKEFSIGLSYVGLSRVRQFGHVYFEPVPLYERLTSWSRSPNLISRLQHEGQLESKFRATIFRDARQDTLAVWCSQKQLDHGEKNPRDVQGGYIEPAVLSVLNALL